MNTITTATPAAPARYRAYVTRDDKFVGEGWTDGEFFWLTDTQGNRISDFCVNKGQVHIAARRRFGGPFRQMWGL